MKKNTIRADQGIQVYQNDIYRLVDEYIDSLDNPDDVKGINKGLFTGMIKYIYNNYIKGLCIDNDNIELLDQLFNIYTSLCYKYNKRPTVLNFSLMVGIDNNTISDWKSGVLRNTDGGELGSLHMRTVKKWFKECESALLDGAIEQNGTAAYLL